MLKKRMAKKRVNVSKMASSRRGILKRIKPQ